MEQLNPNGLYASPAYLTEHGEPQTPQELEHDKSVLILQRNNEHLGWTLFKGDERWQGTPPSSFAANYGAYCLHGACHRMRPGLCLPGAG